MNRFRFLWQFLVGFALVCLLALFGAIALQHNAESVIAQTSEPTKPESTKPESIKPEPVKFETAPTLATPSSKKLTLKQAGLTLEELGTGVYGLIASADFPFQNPDTAICNGAIVVGSDSVLVVDPFQSPALAELMFDTVKTLTDKPVKYVVNTHFHQDHTGGNTVAVAKGIPILGRGLVRELMTTRNKGTDPNLTPPSVIVNSDSEIWLGDRLVKLSRVEGHTPGSDLIAYVPDAKVLIAGDMMFNQYIPFIGDGDVRQWQGSLYRLIATYADAKVLPGHGKVTTVTGMQELQKYFADLVNLALTWKAQGLTKEQAIAQSAKVPEAYKDYKFQALYAAKDAGLPNDLESIYDQITQSATIPLVP